jgi:hypothetical protein
MFSVDMVILSCCVVDNAISFCQCVTKRLFFQVAVESVEQHGMGVPQRGVGFILCQGWRL